MDSLGGLSDTLPRGSAIEASEMELRTAFQQSALALTGLFKMGKKATITAYNAGKREALQDVLEFLQSSLDHPLPQGEGSGPPGGPLSVARLIDYICARQETLRAEEEGDQEEEDQQTNSGSTSINNPRSSTTVPRPSNSSTTSLTNPRTNSSSMFAPRNSATSSSISNSVPVPTRTQSAPTTRHAIQASPIGSTSTPSSPPISIIATPQFRHHPVLPFPSRPTTSFSQSSSGMAMPSSPLASGSITSNSATTTSTTTTGSGSRRRLAVHTLNASTRKNNKPDGSRSERSNNNNSTSSSSALSSRDRTTSNDALASSGSAGSTDVTLGSSMKRRYRAVSVTDLSDMSRTQQDLHPSSTTASVVLSRSTHSLAEGEGEGRDGLADDGQVGNDDASEDIEMEGWDGTGERPPKRVLRVRG